MDLDPRDVQQCGPLTVDSVNGAVKVDEGAGRSTDQNQPNFKMDNSDLEDMHGVGQWDVEMVKHNDVKGSACTAHCNVEMADCELEDKS